MLAPNQDTVGGVQMSERLLRRWTELEAAGGLPIEISAGVVACPEHGTEADALLHKADEAMWRARSVGQPVGVGRLGRAERLCKIADRFGKSVHNLRKPGDPVGESSASGEHPLRRRQLETNRLRCPE